MTFTPDLQAAVHLPQAVQSPESMSLPGASLSAQENSAPYGQA
jgi:hypothetical protein